MWSLEWTHICCSIVISCEICSFSSKEQLFILSWHNFSMVANAARPKQIWVSYVSIVSAWVTCFPCNTSWHWCKNSLKTAPENAIRKFFIFLVVNEWDKRTLFHCARIETTFLLRDLLDVNPSKTIPGSFLQEISCIVCAISTGIEDSDL